MKKLLVIFCLILAGLTAGCSDRTYLSERQLWHVEKKVKQIISDNRDNLGEEEYKQIILAYQELADSYPLEDSAVKAQFAIVRVYLVQGKYSEAQEVLRMVIRNFSHQTRIASRAQFTIGNIFEMQGNYKQALLEYDKVTDLYPLTPIGLETPLYLVRHYKKTNNQLEKEKAARRAERHYKTIINDYSGTGSENYLKQYLARTYFEKKEWDEAIGVFDDIVEANPEAPLAVKVSLAKAQIYTTKMKDFPKAITIYEEFISKYPAAQLAKEVRMKLASLYLVTSQIDEAEQMFSFLLEEYPDDEKTAIISYLGLGSCYQRQGLNDKVVAAYKMIKQKYPDSVRTRGIPVRFVARLPEPAK